MANKNGNPQNFEKGTNFKDRPDRAVEAGRKGGIKRGENIRKKKLLKEELEILLEMMDKNGHTTQEKICFALIKKASEGDTKAFEVIRDTTGQKPIDKQEVAQVPVITDDIR